MLLENDADRYCSTKTSQADIQVAHGAIARVMDDCHGI